MVIYIVRHGQTEENKQKIFQGHLPGALTEQGIAQMCMDAEELANRALDFKCILSSDQKCAVDSASIISERLNIPVIPMEMLRGRDWGEYTGKPINEIKSKYFHDGRWELPDIAETEEAIYNRAKKTLEVLTKQYSNYNIIVVTHGQFALNLLAAHSGCSFKHIPSYANTEIRVLHLY